MFSVNSTKATRNVEQATIIPQLTAASTAPPRNAEEESVFAVVTHHALCTPPRLALRQEDLPGSPPEPGTPNAGPADPSGTPWTNRNLGRALQHSRPIYFSRRIYGNSNPAQANSYIGVLIPPASSATQSTEIEHLNALPNRITRPASVIAGEHVETQQLAQGGVQEALNLLIGAEIQSVYEPTI